jgi:hypothetical protein
MSELRQDHCLLCHGPHDGGAAGNSECGKLSQNLGVILK